MIVIPFLFVLTIIGSVLSSYAANSSDVVRAEKSSDAHVIGHVVDKHTGEHLGFITIALEGTTVGTATDASGHYSLLNLPVGEYMVVASAVGYKPVKKSVRVKSGETLEVHFQM